MNAANEKPPLEGRDDVSYSASMDHRLTVLETRFDTILPTLVTKADLEIRFANFRAEYREDFLALRSEVRLEIAKIRTEMEQLRGEVNAEIAKLRAELLKLLNDQQKWLFSLVIACFLGLAGLNIAMFNSLSNAIGRIEAAQASGRGLPAGPAPAPLPPHAPAAK